MSVTQDDRLLKLATPLEKDFLLIDRMTCSEGLSRLFRVEMDILHFEDSEGHKPTAVDPHDLIGQLMTVSVTQEDKSERYFNGICAGFTLSHRNERFSLYSAVIVPTVWVLTQSAQSRIFQNKTVEEVLKEVFKGFQEIDYEIKGIDEKRNYCVQYRETDWDFASRLMEEEGIYYYFEHTAENHRLIIGNTPQSHRPCPTKPDIPFIYDISEREGEWVGSIDRWDVENNLRTGKFEHWDYNFQLQNKKLNEAQPSLFNIGGNQDLEVYDFPGGYGKRFDGIDKGGGDQPGELQKVFDDAKRTVKIRQEELDVLYKNIYADSDSCAITAGYRFTLSKHPTEEYNNVNYIVVSAVIEAVQSPDYISNSVATTDYSVKFNCIPQGSGQAPFRPQRKTAKPIIHGSQTAFVVGPSGEEIFVDKYGRVKVQFHWDRDGKADDNSSCWIRVAQSWAGNQWGSMFIPRMGMEVVVEFLEGDPDQPIITGCVYNPASMPPYTLPDEKTKSTVKTYSSKDGGGFNEFRFEDKKGSEQVFIHGEKDLDIRIKNDRREWTGNDQHLIVHRDRREKIERDTHLIVERDQIEKIDRDRNLKVGGKEAKEITDGQSLKVGGDMGIKVTGGASIEAGGALYIKGMNVVVEGMTQLTLKVGGNFVNINPAGVQIVGTLVLINSGGAAGTGSAVSIVPPQAPAVADKADDAKPGTKTQLEKQSEARKEKTYKPPKMGEGKEDEEEKKKKKSWIKIKLIDEAGDPVPGEYYKVTTSDGTVCSGTLDHNGQAEIKGIEPGNCEVTFPNLDKGAWEDA